MESLFKKRQERLSIFQRNRQKKQSPHVRKEVPDHVIKPCEQCDAPLTFSELAQNRYVCPKCNHHHAISARERIRQITDDRSFRELDRKARPAKKINFPEYDQKLERYQQATGLQEAVITGVCLIDDHKVVMGVMDSRFMMASMGSVVGDKITRAIEYATRKKLPLILFCASGGARMQEGIVSLMQMAKTSAALERYENAKGFYLSVLTHPTTGGVSASFAMLGDVILAEPNALIGFAGKRVIERTVNEVLPDDFQRSEFLLEKGFVDQIVQRQHLRQTIVDLLNLHQGGK